MTEPQEIPEDEDGRLYIRELPNGQYTAADPEAIKTAKQMRARTEACWKEQMEIKRLIKDCKHEVCYDEPGYIYHSRICLYCGHVSTI